MSRIICQYRLLQWKSQLCKNSGFINTVNSNKVINFSTNTKRSWPVKVIIASTVLFGGASVSLYYWTKNQMSLYLKNSTLLPKNSLYKGNIILYDCEGFILPDFVVKNLSALRTFKCRESDIFVVSFPKSGTTWLQEIIYCIVSDLNFEAASRNIEDRFPYLEFIYPGLASLEKISEQRFIKTHLPFSLLPKDIFEKKPKVFYILRNPKDVAVSYYHFVRMMTTTGYIGSFEDFFQDMLNNRIPYGPLWKHHLDFWIHKDDPNVLVLFYEDLKCDIKGNIKKISKFLGKELSDDEVCHLAKHCSFKSMSNNPYVNYQHWDDLGIRKKNEAKFMRKGEVGDWKNYFNDVMNMQMEKQIQKHLGHTDLHFTYEVSIKK